MIVRYAHELSKGNNFPVIMSKHYLSAIFAPNPTVQANCKKKSSHRAMLKRFMSKKYVHEFFPRGIFPSDLCSKNMPGLPCTRKMSKIVVLVTHADWPMCSAQCPPPMVMGYVHKLCERWMPPCDGSEPWIFLMRMVVVDIATRIYSTSAVKST